NHFPGKEAIILAVAVAESEELAPLLQRLAVADGDRTQVLGYSVSKRLTEELVVKAFANAWALHPQRPGLIFHSDRGGQYWGNEFRQLLQSHDVVQSMSRPGNCWDNAVAESFFATLK
ncbi:transposase, partial [Stenotrophomonas sp. 3diitr2024]|uniref:transposase n=1 Tax=Stenotrophomonas sp. 3diitr2024 TaxID=3345115 RepID=UPI0035C9D095